MESTSSLRWASKRSNDCQGGAELDRMPTIDFSQGVEVIPEAMGQSPFLAASTTQTDGRQEASGAQFRLQKSGSFAPTNQHFAVGAWLFIKMAKPTSETLKINASKPNLRYVVALSTTPKRKRKCSTIV